MPAKVVKRRDFRMPARYGDVGFGVIDVYEQHHLVVRTFHEQLQHGVLIRRPQCR